MAKKEEKSTETLTPKEHLETVIDALEVIGEYSDKAADLNPGEHAKYLEPVADLLNIIEKIVTDKNFIACRDALKDFSQYAAEHKEDFAALEKVTDDLKALAPFLQEELERDPAFNGVTLAEILINGFDADGQPIEGKYLPLIERAQGELDKFAKKVDELLGNNVTAPSQKATEETLTAFELTYKDKPLPPLESMPNGEALFVLSRILSAKNGRPIKERANDRHEKIKAIQKDDNYRFERTSSKKNSIVIVELYDAKEYLQKNNTPFLKVLLFILQKMAAQNFPLEVGFSLKELVSLGIYSNTNNARRAFKEFFNQQKKITLTGEVKKGRQTIKEEGGILFYHYEIKNGYVKLSVNENFNMEFIAPYFTVFPRFIYGLKNNNAFSLGYYIFYLARQNTKSIKEKGTFTINLDTVRDHLGLPTVEEARQSGRKYKQYIIDPIEDAIKDIEMALLNVPEAKDCNFTITPYIPETSNINEWLDGYLEIGLKGDFAKTFIEISTKAEQKKEKFEKLKAAELAKIEAKKEKTSSAPKKDKK